MFTAHAKNKVIIQDDIILITLSGPCNEYDFKDIAGKVKQAVKKYGGKDFCILVNHLEMQGATPEGYQELETLNQWLNTQKMQAKAIVIKLDCILDTFKARVTALDAQNIQVFDTVEDAMLWLRSQLNN